MYYVIKYTGDFGFIKPPTANRSGLIFSQNYLTPANIRGIEKFLFPEELYLLSDYEPRIIRHRVYFRQRIQTVETTHGRGTGLYKGIYRGKATLQRHVLFNLIVHLAFSQEKYAQDAIKHHIHFGAKEHLLFPDKLILKMSPLEFKQIKGFEFITNNNHNNSILIGYDRYTQQPMTGQLIETKGDVE